MVTAALVTVTGTAVVSGALLAFLLSMAPTIQPESAGVRLGVFTIDSVAGASGPGGSAALPVATAPAPATIPVSPGKARAERRITERNRVIAPPSISGRRVPAAPERDPASVAEASAHGLPVIGKITSRFSNARTHPLLGVVRRHNGVDIAAASGTPITAAAAGRVIFAGRKFGFGNTVEIDHGNGVVTRYAHCRTLKVRSGATVEDGATIATVGRTGLASGTHLHFEVLVNGTSVDPLKRPLSSLLIPPSPAPIVVPAAIPIVIPGASVDSAPAGESAADSARVNAGGGAPEGVDGEASLPGPEPAGDHAQAGENAHADS